VTLASLHRCALVWAVLAATPACLFTPGEDDDGGDATGCTPPPSCDEGEFVGTAEVYSGEDAQTYRGFTRISGNLTISETGMMCLHDFACLTDVGRDVYVYGNDALVDLTGLDNLREVGTAGDSTPMGVDNNDAAPGSVTVSNNSALTDLNGLRGLNWVKSNLLITNNASLQTISGLSTLAVVQQNLTIRGNTALQDLGLVGLQAVGGSFSVTQNPALCVSKIQALYDGLSNVPSGAASDANLGGC